MLVFPPTKNMPKRETIGQRLKRERESLDLSAEKLSEKILDEYGVKIGTSTIQATERDRSPNVGRKTLEFICLGLSLDPLQVFAIGLEDPPELAPVYTESRFAQMARKYKLVRARERPFIDFLLDIASEQIERRSKRR